VDELPEEFDLTEWHMKRKNNKTCFSIIVGPATPSEVAVIMKD
jgi:hypothetical protein